MAACDVMVLPIIKVGVMMMHKIIITDFPVNGFRIHHCHSYNCV